MSADLETIRQPESWYGSYYELAIELSAAANNVRLAAAVRRLWDHGSLVGPWPSQETVGREDALFTVTGRVAEHPSYGLFRIGARWFGCVVHVIREENGADWLDLCLPMGQLEPAFDVEYPLDRSTNPWLDEVDAALVDVADWIFSVVPFELGIVGEEVSGTAYAGDLQPEYVARGGFLLSPSHWNRLALESDAARLSSGVVYVPSTGASDDPQGGRAGLKKGDR